MSPLIVFEDESLLVLNKPAGLVTTRAPSVNEPTLEAWLERNLVYPLSKSKKEHAGLAHRLDKETSGLILVGKTSKALENLRLQFKQRKVQKGYWSLVKGKVAPKNGSIDLPLGRSSFNRKKIGVIPGGRPAQTRYRFMKLYRDSGEEKYSLLELWPKTGRTHQLRVHLRLINHPVVGDAKYAGRKVSKSQRRWCPRQFLHAFSISFRHPTGGRRLHFTAPFPEDLLASLGSLERIPGG